MMNSSEDQIMAKNSSWWRRRTKMEKCLVIAVAFIVVVAVSILTVYIISLRNKSTDESDQEEDESEIEVCETPGCIYTSSNVLRYMDESVDPCADFYQFACGGFLKETTIPDDKRSVDSSLTIKEALTSQLRAVIEEPSSPEEPKPFQLFKQIYSICMNTSAIEIDGYDTLFNTVVDVLGGWPVLEGERWNENAFDWKNFTYTSRRLGLETYSFITVYIDTDTKNSSRRVVSLYQPWLEFSREQFHKGLEDELVQSYYEYMVDLAVALNTDEESKEFARYEMRNVLEFESELAKITLTQAEKRNVTGLYNLMTVGELQLKFLDVPWLEYINNVINLTHVVVTENEMVDVSVADYIKNLIVLLDQTPKRTQANYAMFRIIRSLVPYLTEKVRDLDQQYSEKLSGIRTRLPRWKECLQSAESTFDHAAGALYIRKYFNRDAKGNVEEMASDMHSELNKTLEQTEWMDEDTRNRALEKAASMSFHIAYADELLEDKNLEEFYAEVIIDTDNYLTFAMEMGQFDYNRRYSKLRKPVDKNDWTTSPSPIVVNAMYLPKHNSIYLPAGILQGVYFDADRPRYMNYGAIGYVIGHEITHGFDDIGRQFDKDGNVQDWWADNTKKAFLKRAQCIIDQYGKLKVPELNTNINGAHTQGENIADNGGIKLAYSAYQAWVERNEPEAVLPGLNYTQNQMFWISAANSWCSKSRKKTLELDVSEDPHCPPRFRVSIPFSNTQFFADDFNCPVGSKMNPKKKCVVW